MSGLGKWLVIGGLLMVVLGALLWSGVGRDGLGRLPGDLHWTSPRGTFRIYVPIVTCLLVSAVLTLILWLFRR
jgi:hypothetical protein